MGAWVARVLSEYRTAQQHGTCDRMEALQSTQQKMKDDPRRHHLSQGKHLSLPKTPRMTLLTHDANPDDTKKVVTKLAHTSKTYQEIANETGSQGLSLDRDISPEEDIKRFNDQLFSLATSQYRPQLEPTPNAKPGFYTVTQAGPGTPRQPPPAPSVG